MHRHFKVKLFFVQLLTVVPFLIFIFYLSDLWYDTSRSSVIEKNITKAKLVALLLNDSFQHGITISKTFSTDTLLLKSLGSDSEGINLILKNMLTNFPETNSISIRDKEGKILATTLELTEEQKNISLADRAYIQEVLATKKEVVSNPLIDRYTGKNIVSITSPIMKNGSVDGIVTTTYDLSLLKKDIEKILSSSNNGQEVIILDKEKQIAFISGKPFPTEAEKSILSKAPFMQEIQEKKIIVIENQTLPILSKEVIGAVVFMDNSGWIVLSVEPIETIFAPIFKIQGLVWLIIFSGLLFSVSLITYLLRKIRLVY